MVRYRAIRLASAMVICVALLGADGLGQQSFPTAKLGSQVRVGILLLAFLDSSNTSIPDPSYDWCGTMREE